MKKSISADRVLLILSVSIVTQVLCNSNKLYDGEDKYVDKKIEEHKEQMAVNMISNMGLHKASKRLDITPLSKTDIIPDGLNGLPTDSVNVFSGDDGTYPVLKQTRGNGNRISANFPSVTPYQYDDSEFSYNMNQ